MSEITADIEVETGFDPEAKVARQVLAEVLGDGFSREDEEYQSVAWESSHGEPLKRAWESWPEFRARRESFVSSKKRRTYFMDTQSGQDMLRRLRSKDVLAESDVNEIHALEEMLDLKKTNFEETYTKKETKINEKRKETFYFRKATKDQTDSKSLERFEKIQTFATWSDRLKAVHAETDFGALQLVILRDSREEVREAAEQRVIELEIAGK